MSEALKELPQAEENDLNVISTEFSKNLEILDEDFVFVSTSSEVRCKERVESDSSDTEVENIAQHDTSENSKELQLQYDAKNSETIATDDFDRELVVEQQYWDEFGAAIEKTHNLKMKQRHLVSERSMKENSKIKLGYTIKRPPSYYRFDRSTTLTLEKLIEKRYVGQTYNIVGRGSNSVVIYANCPPWPNPIRVSFSDGNAVKVHRLGKDADKNKVILKRAQREYEHLKILGSYNVPYVVHRSKNIIIMQFVGYEQETASSISNLDSAALVDMYHTAVTHMHLWYNKYNIVHGKLCEKNLLYTTHYYALHFIGWSHSVRTNHPLALRKLIRDCEFVTEFFGTKGVKVKCLWDLFKDITGYDKSSKAVEAIYKSQNLWEKGQHSNPNRERETRERNRNTYFKDCDKTVKHFSK